MITLSMTEFKKMCTDANQSIFIFDTTNQPGGWFRKVKVVERYTSVAFMLSPNRICFKNNTGTMCLNNVKSIRYHNDPTNIGEVFSIVCEGKTEDEDEMYVFLLDKM